MPEHVVIRATDWKWVQDKSKLAAIMYMKAAELPSTWASSKASIIQLLVCNKKRALWPKLHTNRLRL